MKTRKNPNSQVVIFDFDGTIADTFDTVIEIGNNIAIKHGYKQFELDDIVKFRNFTSKEVIQKSGVSLFQLPFLLKQVKQQLNSQIQHLTPIPGMKEVILELSSQGHKLGIITSNASENVNLFLEKNELKSAFNFVISGTTLFGKHRIINNCLKTHNINRSHAVYVGDETRDIEAAKRSRIKAIAVTWGFNFRDILAKHHPDFLIDRPTQLLDVVKQLESQSNHAKISFPKGMHQKLSY